jgi:predicted aminopeptidase
MDLVRLSIPLVLLILTTGCQIGYLTKSAYNQLALLSSRTNMEEALKDPSLSEEEKAKIHLSQKAMDFAVRDLHLKASKNYSRFVKLDRPYVTYVVNAASKWELKHYEWSYPFVGKMPYKGFFSEEDAKDEEIQLQKKDLDTYLRGVSAFSTLGWFEDPLLSSMLRYSRHDLVNTIIHETVHSTLYIKNSADFNERMAVFLGAVGTQAFYKKEEGPDSPTLKEIQQQDQDEKIFSQFIGKEIKSLEQWYLSQPDRNEEHRKGKFQEIIDQYKSKVEPQLKSKTYSQFGTTPLNNARILLYKTYVQDLADFEKLYELSGQDVQKFMDYCRSLESHPKPEQGLKDLISQLSTRAN